MYASDYGYAVGGEVRSTCLATNLYSYDTNNCYTSNWLYLSSTRQWSLTPFSSQNYGLFGVNTSGSSSGFNANLNTSAVRPVVYLNTNIQITGGSGTSDDPYTIALT